MEDLDQASTLVPLPRSADFDVDPASFSAAAWLNQVLSSPSAPELAALHDALSDALRESHDALDKSLRDALKAVPWVVRESDRVRQKAKALRAEVDTVGTRVAGVETGVASSVKTIADADTVVRRVQKAATLLETAASADVLLERLESLLASAGADGSDLVTAADVASQLRNALAPLRDVEQLSDRFKQLDQADARLETLAAPQLRRALDARDAQAAVNARIVFDHAGRQNAFRAQYVTLRGTQIKTLWSDAWAAQQQEQQQLRTVETVQALGDNDETTSKTTTTSTSTSKTQTTGAAAGEFAAEGADIALRSFYDAVAGLVATEAEWLREVFPDVKRVLLPALLCDSFGSLKDPSPRANVFIHPSVTDAVAAADAIADRLFTVAETSVSAAAQISETLLLDESEVVAENGNAEQEDEGKKAEEAKEKDIEKKESEDVNEIDSSVADAVSAILMPWRMFWDALLQVAVRQARTRAESISFMSASKLTVGFAPLADIARDVEVCSREACSAMDAVVGNVTTRSCGVGVAAMKQATATLCSVVSDRLLKLLPPAGSTNSTIGGGEDEWTRLGGALRLLIATSGLKRAWDARKEAAFAVAVGTATPVLELSGAMPGAQKRIHQLVSQTKAMQRADAGMLWELGRDPQLAQRVVAEFETMDSVNGSRDFEKVILAVHQAVYDTMFAGVVSRFEQFARQELWSASAATANNGPGTTDADLAMAGLSTSPLRYATEVADYLMAIPQQLEPFVPDEEDAKHATPKSVFQFCKAGPAMASESTSGTGTRGDEQTETDEDSHDSDDDEGMSFAGMWISVLAMGTMELYVEKICSVPRLSEPGARQLATDTDYLCNVMASLGVTPTQDMALVCKLLECKRDATSFTEAAADSNSAQHRKLVRRVAAVRGINVTL